MLVLRRKAGEAIVLNGVITIHVLAVEGERVKLGISAPPEVVIVRSELLENQGPLPGNPASSGSHWPGREAPRPPRPRSVGGATGGEGSAGGAGSPPDGETRDAAPPTPWRESTAPVERNTPATINTGPQRES
jgi:carbon storage regulator